ncbi:MAG: GAF domain-containing protein [Desulfobulbaceae bacterium]|nr:GAF domain-containing protein [Desulfobulbaceae bacterium]
MTSAQHLANMEKENRQFKKLLAIQGKLGKTHGVSGLLPLVIHEISELLDAERTTIFLVDWEHMELQALFAEGVAREELVIKLKMGIVGWSVLSRRPVSIASASDHPYFNPDIDQIHDFNTESIMVAPIIDGKGEVLGAVELLNKATGVFSDSDLETLCREVADLARSDAATFTEPAAAADLIHRLTSATSCERGSVFRIDRSTGQLLSVFAQGLDNTNISLSLNLGVAGLVAATGEMFNIPDTTTDCRFDSTTDLRTGYATRNLLGLPIRNHLQEVIGAIEVINKRGGGFDEQDICIMDGLASIVSIAINNALMLAEQEKQFQSLVEVMAASIDAKDPLTAGHSAQVSEYAVGIGKELGFEGSDLEVIRLAGLLHDYGKLGIDDQILKKPGRLTSAEYSQIQQHVTLTRSILSKMHFTRKYRNVPMVAAAHHEYLDGSGYDSGMTAKEIPFMAKIITVADVFEALTSNRHYRQAMPLPEAFALLEKEAGSKFDPKIIHALKGHLAGLPAPPRPRDAQGNNGNYFVNS